MGFLLHDELFWLVIIFLPALWSFLFVLRGWRPFLQNMLPWTVLPALLMAVGGSNGAGVRIPWLFFEAQFGMDPTARVFLGFTAMVWLMAGIYAVFYLADDVNRTRFSVCYLLAMCGNIGLILAQDVFSFYFLFALMSFASFGLVVHTGTPAARYAGKVYITLVVIGEAFVFSALLMAVHAVGSTGLLDMPAKIALSPIRNVIMAMAFVGFGIKAGALPLHVWLPLAHPVAPNPASAVLSGCMIKAGLLGWLRIFPLGEACLPGWGMLMVVAGLLAGFYGVLVGLTMAKAKTVLAYSSISQMGMMTIVVGMGLLDPERWPMGWVILMIYATHHAIAKGALFLSVGVATPARMESPGRFIHYFGLMLPALAVMGAPWTSGAVAKGGLKYLIGQVSYHVSGVYPIKVFIDLAAIGTVLLMMRLLWLIWPTPERKGNKVAVKTGMFLSWGILVGGVALLPFILDWQHVFVVPGKEDPTRILTLSKLWPLLTGVGLTAVVLRLRWNILLEIPEGDVLSVYSKVLSWTQAKFLQGAELFSRRQQQIFVFSSEYARRFYNQAAKVEAAAQQFSSWKVFGVTFLGFFLILFLLVFY